MLKSAPTAWKQDNRTGSLEDRDVRLYADFRQFEYPDIGTGSAQYTWAREDNLIDRGDCELEIAPMIFGETVPLLSNATFARSATQKHTGDYSYLFTKTIAAGTAGIVYLTDNADAGDMHGMVAGSTYTKSVWIYNATGGIAGSEITLEIVDSEGSTTQAATSAVDVWQLVRVSRTLDVAATYARIRIVAHSDAADTEKFYVDDIRLPTHNVPGTHFLSGGYIENLLAMPDKFTIQIKFKPDFAYDTGSNQELWSWYVSATQEFRIVYSSATDLFRVLWEDGGTARTLDSAQYDDGSAERNINQHIILTAAIDTTTGDTTGSSLWLDKIQDDTVWSGNIDAKTTEFNKMQLRAHNGTAGAFDIAYVRFFPNLVATDAQAQADFKDVKDEEIFWSFDGHGTGRTRVNISNATDKPLRHYDTYKGITSRFNGTFGTNTLNLRLSNHSGQFSDDQNAAWDPANSVYNGTDAQNYLQNRFGVMMESWYQGDFDYIAIGRATEDGFRRRSKMPTSSEVTCNVEDGVGDLDRSFEEFGRIFTDNMLTRQNTIMDRGSCESDIPPPAMRGETSNTRSNATFTRSADNVYHGRFSFVGTKTIAAGTAATIALSDNTSAGDMHTMIPGATYTWRIVLWLPSGAMLGSEFVLAIVDSAGSTTQAATNTYDVFQVVEVTRTLDAGATFAYPQIQIDSDAADDELFHIDAIEFIPGDESEATDNSLLHVLSKRGWRRQIQYAGNNSFEEATIGDTWLVTAGGTLNKDGADGFIGAASAELIPGAAAEQMYGDILFTGTKKLNVGETYTWQVKVKSAGAASGADNYIEIHEHDSGGSNDSSRATYELAGGEDYKSADVQHTITDSDSDRLRVLVSGDAGDTINIDTVMLVQSDRAIDYFETNTANGDSGEILADLGVEIAWPWFGVHTGNVDYIHPWRRMEMNTTVWQNSKSVGAGCLARYCGFDENNTLINHSILDNDYGDAVPVGILTDSSGDLNNVLHDNLVVTLDALSANRIVGYGNKFVKHNRERLVWVAHATGNFAEGEAEQQIAEVVLDDGFFPAPRTYGEYWAEYGVVPTDPRFELTIAPYVTGWQMVTIPEGFLGFKGGEVMAPILAPGATYRAISSKSDRIVGVQDAILIHKTNTTGDGDGPFTYVTAGTLVSGLDITSRAGQARILLMNETGGTVTVVDAAIAGKPVYKYTGADGHIHDDYIDREDIAKRGEQLLEFGGEDVIDGEPNGQLDRLADFIWKDRSTRKHIYVTGSIGALHDLSPADWMRMNIGSAGETENILGVAEILGVRTTADNDTRGITQVTYREVQEGWKYDSNAAARFLARGVPVSKPGGTGGFITIGSEFSHDGTDTRIAIGDTSAEDTINAMIDLAAEAYNGGTVLLGQGTYITDGPIELKANVMLIGEGQQTIIKPSSGNHDCIRVNGSNGSEINNTGVRDLRIERDTAAANYAGILLSFADFVTINNVTIVTEYWGIRDTSSDNAKYSRINIIGSKNTAMSTNGKDAELSDILIDGQSSANALALAYSSTEKVSISGMIIKNVDSSLTASNVTMVSTSGAIGSVLKNITIENCNMASATNTIAGLAIGVSKTIASNIYISDIDNTDTAANSVGLLVGNDNITLSDLVVADCSGTGIDIVVSADRTQIHSGRSTGNGTNFTNSGTNTTAAVEDN